MEEEKFIGTVVWFDPKLNYGFISRPNDKVIFVHWTDIDPESCVGYRILKKGQQVSFGIGLNNKSKPKAINVVIL